MKVKKKKALNNNKRGETIVEVVVAFALLSIMLVLFSQGLAWASNTQIHASDNRKKADDTMIALQKTLATTSPTNGAPLVVNNNGTTTVLPIKRYVYPEGGTYYVVYEYT